MQLSPKKEDVISKYHNFKIIHGRYISIHLYIYICIVCILTLKSNLFFFFFVRFWGTIKEAFVVDAI
jgi:hypothetical protein